VLIGVIAAPDALVCVLPPGHPISLLHVAGPIAFLHHQLRNKQTSKAPPSSAPAPAPIPAPGPCNNKRRCLCPGPAPGSAASSLSGRACAAPRRPRCPPASRCLLPLPLLLRFQRPLLLRFSAAQSGSHLFCRSAFLSVVFRRAPSELSFPGCAFPRTQLLSCLSPAALSKPAPHLALPTHHPKMPHPEMPHPEMPHPEMPPPSPFLCLFRPQGQVERKGRGQRKGQGQGKGRGQRKGKGKGQNLSSTGCKYSASADGSQGTCSCPSGRLQR